LIDAELKRPILTESATALKYWFGVGMKAARNWRKAFSVSQYGTEGSKALHRQASEHGAAKTRGKPHPPETWRRMRLSGIRGHELSVDPDACNGVCWMLVEMEQLTPT
jgi:hypothetical protein